MMAFLHHASRVRKLLDAAARRRDLVAVGAAVAAYAAVARLVPLTGRPSDPALAMVAVLVFVLLWRRP